MLISMGSVRAWAAFPSAPPLKPIFAIICAPLEVGFESVEVASAVSRASSASFSNSFLVFGCDFREARRRRSCWRWREVLGAEGVGSSNDMFM